MNKIKTDILIIGGGPSGCAAALSAYNEGSRDITIIEKQPFDRHRIGEILLTQTIMEFDRLGIADELHPYIEKYGWNKKFAASYVNGKDRTPWQVVNNHPGVDINAREAVDYPSKFVDDKSQIWYTLVVRRHEFDVALREICESRGISIIHGSVTDCKIINEKDLENSSIVSVDVLTNDKEEKKIYPNFTIDSTGQQAFLGKKNKNRKPFGDMGLQARYTYFSDVDFDQAVKKGFHKEGANIISFDDGWVWIAHLGKNQTTLGIVSKHWDGEENQFWKKLKRLPEYELFNLDKANVVSYKNEPVKQDNFYAHSNYRFKTEVFKGKNWGCSGDAAMFLDPLLSQGVTLAVSYGGKLGKIAHDVIHQGVDNAEAMNYFMNAYIKEIEILNKVVTLWYKKDFSITEDWFKTSSKISNIFGREIGEDVEAFRWISNLENIHKLFERGDLNDFLTQLNDVNTIELVHAYEAKLK